MCGEIQELEGWTTGTPIPTQFYTNQPPDKCILAWEKTYQGEWYTLIKLKSAGEGPLYWEGGRFIGTFPASTSWERMHDAYGFSLDYADECTINKIRMHNTGDGISIKGVSEGWMVGGSHFTMCRDDVL